MMPGIGGSLLGGAAGAAGGLETLIARRLAEQRQASDEALSQAQLQETMRARQANEAEALRYHGELAADREAGREAQKVQMANAVAAQTQAGADRDEDRAARVSAAQQASDDRAAQRETQLSIAKLASARPSGAPRVMSIKGPNGEDLSVLVSPSGEVMFSGASQLPAGMKSQQAEQGTINDQIDTLLALGEQTGGAGTGVVAAPFGRILKSTTGLGSDTADTFRVGLDSLAADIAHGKYGSAFTATEKAQLSTFAPKSGMAWPAIKNRLLVMKRITDQRTAELKAGQRPTPIQLPTGTGPVAAAGPIPGAQPAMAPSHGTSGRPSADDLIRKYGQ